MADVADVQVRLKTLLTAVYRENENERSNAARALYRFLVDSKLHPADITLSVGSSLIERNQRVIATLETQIKLMHQEIVFLRRHTSDDVLRQAQQAASVDFAQWLDLKELLLCYWNVADLPDNWCSELAKLTGVGVVQINRWQAGLVEVPKHIFALVRNIATSPPPEQPKESQNDKVHANSPRRRGGSRPIQTTAKEMTILKALLELSESTTNNLSYHVYDAPPSTSVYDMLDTLRKKGFVDRRRVKKRQVYFVTAKGRSLMIDATPSDSLNGGELTAEE